MLICVDIQPAFQKAINLRLLRAIRREIIKATQANEEIIFVEYEYCEPTLPELTSLVEDYPRKHFITKFEDDGTKEVLRHIFKHELDYSTLRIVGVNSDLCVKFLVNGLVKRFSNSKIEVVRDGINSDFMGNHIQALREFELNKNIILV